MWNSIFLSSTTFPPKDLRPKPSPLVEQFFGRCPRPPYLFSRVEVSDSRRKKGVVAFCTCSIYRGGWWVSRPYKSIHLLGRLISPAAPTVPFVGAGLVGLEHTTVGAAPSPAAPTKKLSRCYKCFLVVTVSGSDPHTHKDLNPSDDQSHAANIITPLHQCNSRVADSCWLLQNIFKCMIERYFTRTHP